MGILSACALSSALLLIGHWFPWIKFLGRELHKLEAYVYGTLSIFAGFALMHGNKKVTRQLATIIIASGIATFAAWGIDTLGLRIAITRRLNKRHEYVSTANKTIS